MRSLCRAKRQYEIQKIEWSMDEIGFFEGSRLSESQAALYYKSKRVPEPNIYFTGYQFLQTATEGSGLSVEGDWR